MRHRVMIVLAGLALLAFGFGLADRALAEGGVENSTGGGVIVDYKTPPLQTSDVIDVPLTFHAPGLVPNWAGAMIRVHILDNQEVDVDGITLTDGTAITEPFGARSQNEQSAAQQFTFWHPSAPNSGVALNQSQMMPVAKLTLHAKNTTPINNSDVDITVGFWNIRHLLPGLGSSFIHLNASDYMYGTPNFNPVTQSELPPFTIEPGGGVWFHVTEAAGKTIHLPAGQGSHYYATFVNTAKIGMEHVPEPAGVVLLVGGAVAAGLAWLSRRRRRRAT